jgi:tetratricopeptide (TPR) repeat protein
VCLPPAELDAVVADLEKKNAARIKALFASIPSPASAGNAEESDDEERAARAALHRAAPPEVWAVTIKSLLENWLVTHLRTQANSTPSDELASSRWMLLLGGLYFELGKVDHALPILEAAFGTRRRLLGTANDSISFAAMDKVAKIYDEKHDYAKALPLFKECLEKYAAVLGAEHPTTMASHFSLAAMYHHWNDYSNALELYQDFAVKVARAREKDPYSTVLASLPDAAKLDATIALVKKLVSASASTQRRRNSKTGLDVPGPMQRRGSKTGME